ncbi:MAG: hypothetical protein WDO71_19685 [Bacteroidota bacterium]
MERTGRKNGTRRHACDSFATKYLNELPAEIKPEIIEKELEFLGLAGLIDPPREEAKEAIKECKTRVSYR